MSNSKPMNLSVAKLRSNDQTVDLNDPRSPSSDFRRTPIRVLLQDTNADPKENQNGRSRSVERSLHLFSTSSNSSNRASLATEVLQRISSSNSFVSMDDSSSFYSASLDAEDSPMAIMNTSTYEDSENDTELMNEPILNLYGQSGIKNANDTRKLPCLNDKSIVDTIFYENTKSPEKSSQYEPDTPNKKRNPLEVVEANCLQPVTPLSRSLSNMKQWKRIREERQKLGLACDENFALPLYDVTTSAPELKAEEKIAYER